MEALGQIPILPVKRSPTGNSQALLSFGALSFLTLLILLIRTLNYNMPTECDGQLFAATGHGLLQGKNLYSDFWDNKPPLIFLTFAVAELISSFGRPEFYVLGVLSSVLGMLGIFSIGRRLGRTLGTAFWPTLFWVILSGDFWTTADQPRLETFMNVLDIWVFFLMLGQDKERPGLFRSLAIGCLLFLDTLYKPYIALIWLFLSLALWNLSERTQKTWIFKTAILSLSILIIGWIGLWAYFISTDRGLILWQTLVIHGSSYGGNIFLNILSGFQPIHLMPKCTAFLLPMFLAALSASISTFKRFTRFWALWWAWGMATFLVVCFTGCFFPYYYQLWIPVACIGMTGFFRWMEETRPKWLGTSLAGIIFLFLVFFEGVWYLNSPRDIAYLQYGTAYIYNEEVGKAVETLLKPGETFYEWDYGIRYMVPSHRWSAADVLFSSHLFYPSPIGPLLSQRTLQKLEAHPPELVVVDREFGLSGLKDYSFNPDTWNTDPVYHFILSRYEPFSYQIRNRIVFYCLKGGSLEKRLKFQPVPRIDPYVCGVRWPFI